MKLASILTTDVAALLLLLVSPTASMLRCDQILADKHKFDLSPLGGPHSVVVAQWDGFKSHNTTFTTDICRPLRRSGDVPKDEECQNGARVCAIERQIEGGSDMVIDAWAVAGELNHGQGGGSLDPEVFNLRTSDSIGDSKKEGVRVIMKGGFHDVYGMKRQQRSIIEFICDETREGTEGEWSPEDKYEPDDSALRVRDSSFGAMEDAGDGDGGAQEPDQPIQLGDPKNASLVFESYGALESDPTIDVLKLTWKTKYACENRSDEGHGGEPSVGWGFFTWLVILIFLGTAAYLIFGSWLNYNRYGARGWDLLPHGDTIRDIPYLMKDWTRRVLNTVQGSGSRGGYSAV